MAGPASVKTTPFLTVLCKKYVVQALSCHPVVFPSHHPSVVERIVFTLFALFFTTAALAQSRCSINICQTELMSEWFVNRLWQVEDMGSREEDVTRPEAWYWGFPTPGFLSLGFPCLIISTCELDRFLGYFSGTSDLVGLDIVPGIYICIFNKRSRNLLCLLYLESTA